MLADIEISDCRPIRKKDHPMPSKPYLPSEFSFYDNDDRFKEALKLQKRRGKRLRFAAVVLTIVLAIALMLGGLSSCYNQTDTSVPTVVSS